MGYMRHGVTPIGPRPQGTRRNLGMKHFYIATKHYLQSTSERANRYCSYPGGCYRARIGGRGSFKMIVAQVIEDENGDQWWPTSRSRAGIHGVGWRAAQPCEHCGDTDYEELLAGMHEWQADAPCSYRPDLDFLDLHDASKRAEARRVCASCPVIEKCREWAYAMHTVEGYIPGLWAGEGPDVRRAKLGGPQR